MNTPFRLHHAADTAATAVRLALEEAGLKYDLAPINIDAGDNRTAAYLAINPNGMIPVLETPDGAIFETGAILLWLADRHPQAGLFPAPDAPGRASALKWLFWLANSLHPAERLLFYPERHIADVDGQPAALRKATALRVAAMFDMLETGPDTQWLEAEGPSILACYLAMLLRWPALYGGDASWYQRANWPRLMRFAARFEARPAVRRVAEVEELGMHGFSNPQP